MPDILSPSPQAADATPVVSVVVPVKNEAENIRPLVEEIHAALDGKWPFEIVYVDDGSTDATPERLAECQRDFPQLRWLTHRASCGQSTAIRTGILSARAEVIATLDGDGQNDPADIPHMLKAYLSPTAAPELRMIAGQRVRRNDTYLRRLSSRVANAIRGRLLGDGIPDTGCGLKVFSRDAFLRLPFFDHLHRFLPALMQREGYSVEVAAVNHRPRERGTSKYGLHNRLWVGIVDLLGVMWLQRRGKVPQILDSQ